MWAWRVACALAVCACAATAPLDAATAPPPPPSSTYATPGRCDSLILKNSALPTNEYFRNIPEHEEELMQLARLYARQVSRGAADKSSGAADVLSSAGAKSSGSAEVSSSAADEKLAAYLALQASYTSLLPLPRAVALAAPHLRLGVLYLVDAKKIYIFQENNTQALQPFWVTLASAWNVSSVVWSPAWAGCGEGFLKENGESSANLGGWWSGAAASYGERESRVAAALFWRHYAMPCEPAMYDHMGGAPNCDNKSTLCEAFTIPSDSSPPKLTYHCRCRNDHRLSSSEADEAYWHAWVDGDTLTSQEPLTCTRCAKMHNSCIGYTGRIVFLVFNLLNFLFCIFAASCVFKRRKRKLIASSIWTILELVVIGGFLMCASAAISLIDSPLWTCLAGPWLRELGFITCFGAVVLRLWVLLAEFRTRKAHRWTPRDAEVLKILGAMLLGAVCYLSAFTATSLCPNTDETRNAYTNWHHVTAAAEILILLVGLRIGYAARNANVPFKEHRWLCCALVVEVLNIAGWRAAAWSGSLAPEDSIMAAFTRAHVSGVVVVTIVLLPQLRASRHHETSRCSQSEGFMSANAGGCGGGGGGGGGEDDQPSVEEARAELRRLYAALEAMRGRALRRDNPHVSRRRGGRKPPHRRFSLQALQARRGGKGKSGNSTVEASDVGESRTPEDSVCSIEGPSHFTDGD